MFPLLKQKHEAIVALCRTHGVARLELFGSAARGEFDSSKSDYDFFVEFVDQQWQGSSDRYFGLLHGLEDLLGRPIDLVDRCGVHNAIFLDVANQHIEQIYDANTPQAA